MYGAFEPYLPDTHNLMAYFRKGDKTLLVMGNYQKEAQTVKLPSEYKKVLLNNYPELSADGLSLKLSGYQVIILEM